jgi:hypothetical protein
MRMVWWDHSNYHRFEVRKMQRRALRAWTPRLQARPKVENDREDRRDYPGNTGRWPLTMKKLPKRAKSSRWIRSPLPAGRKSRFGRN